MTFLGNFFLFFATVLLACNGNSQNPDIKDKTMGSTNKIIKSEEDWKQQLTPEQYEVLRNKGTERPFSGKYYLHNEKGIYTCAACGQELFQSNTKFDAGCGWPSFL